MSCYILSPKGVRKLLEVASPIPTTDPLDVFLRCQFHRFSAVFAQTHGKIWPPQQKTTFPSTSKEVQPDQQAQLREWFESTQVDQTSPTLEEFLNVLNRWKDRIFKEAIGLRMGPLWNGLNTVKQKLQSRKKIYVMGNGPVAEKRGASIDADADAIIIRCNHFRQHTFEMTHGRRTDVQICNVHGAFSFADMEQWLDRDALIVVAEKGTSRARQQDYVHYLVQKGFTAFGVDEALHQVLFGKDRDCTRGMLAWIFAFAAYMDHAVSTSMGIHLYGFVPGGGHQTDPKCRINHGVSDEYQLLAKLDKWFPWFTWHQQAAAGPAPTVWSEGALRSSLVPGVPATGMPGGGLSEYGEFDMAEYKRLGCHFGVGTLGDSTWMYFDKKFKVLKLGQYVAMVVPMHMDGHSLRENKRGPERKIVDILDSPGFKKCHAQSPVRCWNVPYCGGIRGQTELQGQTTAEAAVTGVVPFLPPLVSLFGWHDWKDENHPNFPAIQHLLETMIQYDESQAFLKAHARDPEKSENPPDDKIPFFFVLSDGWNKTHWRDMAYVSAYWKCRMDFGSCLNLAEVRAWANHYVSWKTVQPAYHLPPHILPKGQTTMPV